MTSRGRRLRPRPRGAGPGLAALRVWLDEDRVGQQIRRHLAMAAAGWEALDRPEARALPRRPAGRGARVARARSRAARRHRARLHRGLAARSPTTRFDAWPTRRAASGGRTAGSGARRRCRTCPARRRCCRRAGGPRPGTRRRAQPGLRARPPHAEARHQSLVSRSQSTASRPIVLWRRCSRCWLGAKSRTPWRGRHCEGFSSRNQTSSATDTSPWPPTRRGAPTPR